MNSWKSPELPAVVLTSPQLFLTNSATQKKEAIPYKPIYRMYVCGITPYDATHLGHAATYLTFDLIHRFFLATGSQVRYVQNITDIDDPLLERAARDGVDWTTLAHQQIDLFRGDMEDLRVIAPSHYIGAVEAIPLVATAIEELIKKESIYTVDEDLYFSVHSDAAFGTRSNLNHEEMEKIFSERGGDPDRAGKRDSLDCLVWMNQRPNEPGWPSNFGVGRPGWHIECTAIAMEFLSPSESDGTLIDIQGGGSDLIFPHHEMCAAQAQVISGKPLASTYVHAGMIGLDGEKMSKSKGNLVFVSKLVAEGHDPMAIRWALMHKHYRSDRMWDQEQLLAAHNQIVAIRSALQYSEIAPTEKVISSILEHLSDDLDTPSVIKVINEWVDATIGGSTGGDAHHMRQALDLLLGLQL